MYLKGGCSLPALQSQNEQPGLRDESASCKEPARRQSSGRLRLQFFDRTIHEPRDVMFDQINSCRADAHDLSDLRYRKLSQGVKVENLEMLRFEKRFHALQLSRQQAF